MATPAVAGGGPTDAMAQANELIAVMQEQTRVQMHVQKHVNPERTVQGTAQATQSK